MIETTADVVSGDSGGPLFDAEGEVVGIDTAASTGSEIDGYAIPIARALGIVEQIRSGAETSAVRIGPAAFLGVELSSGASDYAYGFGYGRNASAASGATVGNVISGTAAAGGIMNVNRASSSEMVLLLGLPKDMADRIVSNRPYKVKGELVAKNVVPKETFDMIKDRISVSP